MLGQVVFETISLNLLKWHNVLCNVVNWWQCLLCLATCCSPCHDFFFQSDSAECVFLLALWLAEAGCGQLTLVVGGGSRMEDFFSGAVCSHVFSSCILRLRLDDSQFVDSHACYLLPFEKWLTKGFSSNKSLEPGTMEDKYNKLCIWNQFWTGTIAKSSYSHTQWTSVGCAAMSPVGQTPTIVKSYTNPPEFEAL